MYFMNPTLAVNQATCMALHEEAKKDGYLQLLEETYPPQVFAIGRVSLAWRRFATLVMQERNQHNLKSELEKAYRKGIGIVEREEAFLMEEAKMFQYFNENSREYTFEGDDDDLSLNGINEYDENSEDSDSYES